MPNAIRFDVHHPARARRARSHAAPTRRAGKRSELSTARRLSRILVATDGTAASEGAVLVAGLLARRHHASVDVVSVLPRWGDSPPVHEFLPITGELLEERLASVIPQGQRALGNGTPSWTIRLIDSSSIVDSIAETARTGGHDLIVTGNRRGWTTRWLRRPTALVVAQRSGVAVLVVPQSASTLPARAIVGVGGTDADPAIATSTVGVLAENAPVHLVHVDSADATARLTAYAKRTDADLIALGDSHPATIADRVSGGTRRRILRAFDGFVLLRGTETSAHGRAPDSEGPGPWPQ